MAAARKPQQQEVFGEGLLRNLIASLMGDKDVTFKMHVRVNPDQFPDSMPLEADMLRVIYSCVAKEVAPTPENVVNGLKIERKRREKKEDLERFVDKLYTRLEDHNRNPALFSMWGYQYWCFAIFD